MLATFKPNNPSPPFNRVPAVPTPPPPYSPPAFPRK